MIEAIIIPVLLEHPVHLERIDESDISSWQQLVDGPFQALDLKEPESSLFINDEGKLRGLPMNRRATALLWGHNPAFRYRDVIVGPAVLHGPVGPDGESTSVPRHFTDLLLHTGNFGLELARGQHTPLTAVSHRFCGWLAAYETGLIMMRGHEHDTRLRVITTD